MGLRYFLPCQPCCSTVCEIGFYTEINYDVVNAFPNAHGNANVDIDQIGDRIYGENNNKPLDVFYWGMLNDRCDVTPLPSQTEIGDIGLWMVNGGKCFVVGENSKIVLGGGGCLDGPQIDDFNDFLRWSLCDIRFVDETNIDHGCQVNTNLVTGPAIPDTGIQADYDHLLNGVDQINDGGSNALTTPSAHPLLLANDDESTPIIMWEKLGSGYYLVMGDYNMITSCAEFNTSCCMHEGKEDGDVRKLLGNFCTI